MKAIVIFKNPYYILKVRKKKFFVNYWVRIYQSYNLLDVEKEYSKIKKQKRE